MSKLKKDSVNTSAQQDRPNGPNFAVNETLSTDTGPTTKTVKITYKHKFKAFFIEKKAVHFSESEEHAINSGVHFKNKKYVTHSKLDHNDSAVYTFIRRQKIGLILILGLLGWAFFTNPVAALGVIIAILSLIYFIDSVFTLYLVRKNLDFPAELNFSDEEIGALKDKELPVYTVLAPLYKEFEVLPDFVENMKALDYPHNKLDVILLLEENDTDTIALAEKLKLPKFIRTLIVPPSNPKTKPKACNYGLWHAKGEYVVIYDAEDRTDPQQLKKAYLAFQKLGDKVACVQAKLNYFNSNQNLLTRFFTAEYSLWFDVILPGFQSINTPIPLGGTSNHFRVNILKQLHGWDAFNVTEDCDLGIRLFKKGYKTAIIESVTWEEANSEVKNWIRQRSRWIKGYLQTYLVHMRRPMQFLAQKGIHWFIFQLIIGMRVSFIVINPILWAMTIAYFLFNAQVGDEIEALYPGPVFYMAVFSLVFGNFVYLYNYMIGLAKRGKWSLIKYVFFVPFYWLLMAVAAWMAIYQLFVKPHHWEKTNHGLIKDKKREWKFAGSLKKVDWAFAMINVGLVLLAVQLALTFVNTEWSFIAIEGIFYTEVVLATLVIGILVIRGLKYVGKLPIMAKLSKRSETFGTLSFIVAGGIASIINYAYNVYLARELSFAVFGVLSLTVSFLFITTIPLTALLRTVTQKIAFYFGKEKTVFGVYWNRVRKKSLIFSILITLLWLISIPFLSSYLNIGSYYPLLFITPIFILNTLYAVDFGLLSGTIKFYTLSVLLLVEAASKLVFSIIVVETGYEHLVYFALPISLLLPYLVAYLTAKHLAKNVNHPINADPSFSGKTFWSYTTSRFSVIAFMTFDLLLAKHFLSPVDAGKYAVIALVGKMIFFIGTIISEPLIPLVSKKIGANKDTKKVFYAILSLYLLASFTVYVLVGLLGPATTSLIFGPRSTSIAYLTPIFGLGVLMFSIASFLILYKQVQSKHYYAGISVILTIIQIIAVSLNHSTLEDFVYAMSFTGFLSLIIISISILFERHLVTIVKNSSDAANIFTDKIGLDPNNKNLKILIFNWRDTKHVWAGGAELYVHEIAKRMVEKGHQVTVVCGNDQWNIKHEKIEGVHVIRRGGFYTVYFWAALYYIVKLRGKYDVIIDSENGIPFFTPIFTRIPVICLVHHVHQDFFRKNLIFGVRHFAMFLEAKVVPVVYRKCLMVTVSHSSKEDMRKINLGKSGIYVVHPGVELEKYAQKAVKTQNPQIIYLGRLAPYKSLHTLIDAMSNIVEQISNAKLIIAGFVESRSDLEKQVACLNLQNHVFFPGKVSEEEKVKLLSESWVFVQPSQIEGWGISVIEANAAGTPVVASNVKGLNESVKNPHTGILVPYGDSAAFADKIKLILTNSKIREEFSENSIKWAERFSWDESAEKMIAIITNYLGILHVEEEINKEKDKI